MLNNNSIDGHVLDNVNVRSEIEYSYSDRRFYNDDGTYYTRQVRHTYINGHFQGWSFVNSLDDTLEGSEASPHDLYLD